MDRPRTPQVHRGRRSAVSSLRALGFLAKHPFSCDMPAIESRVWYPNTPGKTEVWIYDYVDRKVPLLLRMSEKRLRGHRAMGYDKGDD